jgi:hypothetical protein
MQNNIEPSAHTKSPLKNKVSAQPLQTALANSDFKTQTGLQSPAFTLSLQSPNGAPNLQPLSSTQNFRSAPFMMGLLYLPFGFIGLSLSNVNNVAEAVSWTVIGFVPGLILLASVLVSKRWGVWLARFGFVAPTIAFFGILKTLVFYRAEHSAIANSLAPYMLLIIFLPAPVWIAYSFGAVFRVKKTASKLSVP